MGFVVSFVAQKGGVGKSTLARALAREASGNGWNVKVADLDTQQGTVAEWHRERLAKGHEPVGSVEVIASANKALSLGDDYDLLILDAGARASEATGILAQQSDLVVLPTGASLDDLRPAVRLAHELSGKKKIDNTRIVFALARVTTAAEIDDARSYIEEAGYSVLEGALLEKPAYRQAQNEGLAATETRYKSVNEKADELMQSLANRLTG